jgi:hypothetical protein
MRAKPHVGSRVQVASGVEGIVLEHNMDEMTEVPVQLKPTGYRAYWLWKSELHEVNS